MRKTLGKDFENTVNIFGGEETVLPVIEDQPEPESDKETPEQ